MQMHYMHSLTTSSDLHFDDAIQRFGDFSLLLDYMFRVHRGTILARVHSVEEGGFFRWDLDIFLTYLRDIVESPSDLCLRWTKWSVMYTVRHNMSVDALCHVNALQRGWVAFRYDYDGSCDWAIKEHNSICH